MCTNTRAMNSWMLSPKPTTSASATESMSSRRLNLRRKRKNTDGWRMLPTSKHEGFGGIAYVSIICIHTVFKCIQHTAWVFFVRTNLLVTIFTCMIAHAFEPHLANATASNGHSMDDVWKLMSNMTKWPAHSKEAVTFWQGILSRRSAMVRREEM